MRLMNLATTSSCRTLRKGDIVEGSVFCMGDVVNGDGGVEIIGDVGDNYVDINHYVPAAGSLTVFSLI